MSVLGTCSADEASAHWVRAKNNGVGERMMRDLLRDLTGNRHNIPDIAFLMGRQRSNWFAKFTAPASTNLVAWAAAAAAAVPRPAAAAAAAAPAAPAPAAPAGHFHSCRPYQGLQRQRRRQQQSVPRAAAAAAAPAAPADAAQGLLCPGHPMALITGNDAQLLTQVSALYHLQCQGQLLQSQIEHVQTAIDSLDPHRTRTERMLAYLVASDPSPVLQFGAPVLQLAAARDAHRTVEARTNAPRRARAGRGGRSREAGTAARARGADSGDSRAAGSTSRRRQNAGRGTDEASPRPSSTNAPRGTDEAPPRPSPTRHPPDGAMGLVLIHGARWVSTVQEDDDLLQIFPNLRCRSWTGTGMDKSLATAEAMVPSMDPSGLRDVTKVAAGQAWTGWDPAQEDARIAGRNLTMGTDLQWRTLLGPERNRCTLFLPPPALHCCAVCPLPAPLPHALLILTAVFVGFSVSTATCALG